MKWAGGKKQLLDQFASLFPKRFDRYFEPMVGSGAVFFYITKTYNPKSCMISDINENLMQLYIVVRDRVDELIKELREHKAQHMHDPETYYYTMRERYNSMDYRTAETKLEKSALMLYLNKTCFNGLYRVNSEGKFNVPLGRYKNPAIVQKQKLHRASQLLQDVEIRVMGFEKVLNFVKENDFVYFDPPYYPLSATSSFTSYQKDAFLDKQQKQLAQVFRDADKRGCLVMLSNSDTDFIRDLYGGYDIQVVKAKRMINCKAEGRGAINELVIRNYQS
ncbi:MAG: DNA adenine methylase [Candidatus Thermoplasmatota archaeon]|nr:DNA adenine methylase [Candidatus Thermoplasmatota archaeon]